MPGDRCIVCGNSRVKDSSTSFHHFPADEARRNTWLRMFQLDPSQVKPHTRVCCRHFPEGDVKKDPKMTLGKRFASPVKKKTPRAKRAKSREENKQLTSFIQSPSSSRSVTPTSTPSTPLAPESLLTAAVGEQLESDYNVYELPSDDSGPSTSRTAKFNAEVLVDKALLAQTESLEAENMRLKKKLKEATAKSQHFRIQNIYDKDNLVRFYTGFVSYMLFQAFFEFLGPVVHHLNYWGSKEGPRHRTRARKLDPENQLFLTLVKLRLNLKLTDLAF